ncbi:MAG: DUF5320 domain-containing protein [Bacteroidales bacterium]|nr:DUF5320 domain-containing protein [Bacteroidales bacterium]
MPGGDRTGPYSEGPMTGRGLGNCGGNEQPDFMNGRSFRGRGQGGAFRRGFGNRGGFGFRHGSGNTYPTNVLDVSEKTMIENEIRILKDQMSSLENQLSKLGEE